MATPQQVRCQERREAIAAAQQAEADAILERAALRAANRRTAALERDDYYERCLEQERASGHLSRHHT